MIIQEENNLCTYLKIRPKLSSGLDSKMYSLPGQPILPGKDLHMLIIQSIFPVTLSIMCPPALNSI
jgi:hypothetical protein